MKFILYSDIDEKSIRARLGQSEYSYFFVLKAFQPALERLGTIVLIRDIAQIDAIFDACQQEGEACLFLSFAPPHKTPIGHRCPTIIVFAWEFPTIPDEPWDGDPRNDWRYVLALYGRAICLSNHTVRAVKNAMGEDYPIVAIAGCVWDRFATLRATPPRPAIVSPRTIEVHGWVLDTRTAGLSADYLLKPPPPLPVIILEPVPGEPAAIAEVAVEEAVAPAAEDGGAAEQAAEQEPTVTPPPEPQAPDAGIGAVAAAAPVRPRLVRAVGRARGWYRAHARENLPSWLVWLVSRTGGILHRSYRLIRRAAYSEQSHEIAPAADPPRTAELIEPLPAAECALPPPDEVPPAEPEAPVEESLETPEPPPEQRPIGIPIVLSGVVYTSVFNPIDGRKNWGDLISGFCLAFRDDEDATLILKMVNAELGYWYHPLLQMLSQMSPFKCRVIAINAYLETEAYEAMIAASSYYVNVSCNEGLCLPLMEFMSVGVPAVAPAHTAMADYIDASNAIVIEGATIEHNVWPHDPRKLFSTERYRMNWECVWAAYRESYRVAKDDPKRYAAMSESATRTMRNYSSDDAIVERLRVFLARPFAKAHPVTSPPNSTPPSALESPEEKHHAETVVQ